MRRVHNPLSAGESPWRPTGLLWGLSLIVLLFTAGCGGYRIEGRVVQGAMPSISFVPASDPSLSMGRGVPGAEVSLYRDPDRLNRERVAVAHAGSDGSFILPVGAFGAGWMEEVWGFQASARGHERAERVMPLPSSTRRLVLLVVLPEGYTPPDPRDLDTIREIERYR